MRLAAWFHSGKTAWILTVLAVLVLASAAVLVSVALNLSLAVEDDTGLSAPPQTLPPQEELVPGGAQTEEPVSQTRLTFLAAGDNIIHGNIYIEARERAKGTDAAFDFAPVYGESVAKTVAAADLAFINQESILGGTAYRPSGYPRFNTPDELGNTLVDMGFDIVNIANNHMLDKNEDGLAHAISFWESQPVLLVGGMTKENREEIRILEKDGVKIAFLAYTDMTNFLSLPASSDYVIPYTDDDLIRRQITAARAEADLVFVSVHWGTENEKKENGEQKRIAQLMCDCGADVILGTHPHVIQSLEWLEGADGHRTLVAYSLGDFLSTMEYGRNLVGILLTFDIVSDGERAWVENPAVIPTVTHYTEKDYSYDWLVENIRTDLLQEYTEARAAVHGCRAVDPGFSLTWAENYVRGAIEDDYLPAWLKTAEE